MKNLAINTYPVINGVYRHYKGGIYKVLFLSKHTETEEVMVNCKSLLFGSYHSRPLDKWLEELEKEKQTEIQKSRFCLILDPKEYEPCV